MLTVRGLEVHRGGMLSERLKYHQRTVKLAREQIGLLECITVELESSRDRSARVERRRGLGCQSG